MEAAKLFVALMLIGSVVPSTGQSVTKPDENYQIDIHPGFFFLKNTCLCNVHVTVQYGCFGALQIWSQVLYEHSFLAPKVYCPEPGATARWRMEGDCTRMSHWEENVPFEAQTIRICDYDYRPWGNGPDVAGEVFVSEKGSLRGKTW